MPIFAYKAMNASGDRIRGQMEASNLLDLESRLDRMQLDLIVARPHKQGLRKQKTLSRRELIDFCFHLEHMQKAGVPLVSALADLCESTEHVYWRDILGSLIEDINNGKRLSQAMSQHPAAFDIVIQNLVAAGEVSGDLPSIFAELVDTLKWQDEVAAQTRKLLAYPCFMGMVVIASCFFMLLYLVPQMTLFMRNMGQELPLQTRMLIAASDTLRAYWPLILLSPVLAVVIVWTAIKHFAELRLSFHRQMLRLPLIGSIRHKMLLARFAHVFAMMYASGIAMLDALRTSEAVISNEALAQAIRRATQSIAEGEKISAAFQCEPLFPPLFIRMLRVGENTGGLDTALHNLSYFYSRDVRESIESLQTLIEPTLTLILGLLLGWVMLAVLGPIYDLIGKLRI